MWSPCRPWCWLSFGGVRRIQPDCGLSWQCDDSTGLCSSKGHLMPSEQITPSRFDLCLERLWSEIEIFNSSLLWQSEDWWHPSFGLGVSIPSALNPSLLGVSCQICVYWVSIAWEQNSEALVVSHWFMIKSEQTSEALVVINSWRSQTTCKQ